MRVTRKRAVLPGTFVSRNSPRMPERATGVDPSTTIDASEIGSPLLASVIVPPMVPAWARASDVQVTLVSKRRRIARERGRSGPAFMTGSGSMRPSEGERFPMLYVRRIGYNDTGGQGDRKGAPSADGRTRR